MKTALIIITFFVTYHMSMAQDTVRCYGVTDLRKIALKLTEGQQCDTLLKIAEKQISNRDSLVVLKDRDITSYKTESSLKESIISVKEQKIQTLSIENKSLTGKLKRTKTGWVLTTCLLLFAVGYTSIK